MRLHIQLFIISLITLALPWAGCQYVKEMETALRSGQEQAVQATANAIASTLTRVTWPKVEGEQVLYAHSLNMPLVIDGYHEDWPFSNQQINHFLSLKKESMAMRLGAGGDQALYLHITYQDDRVIYQTPMQRSLFASDALLIRVQKGQEHQAYLVRTPAPGKVIAEQIIVEEKQVILIPEPDIQGQWQETAQGINIELRIAHQRVGDRVAAGMVDYDFINQVQTVGALFNEPVIGEDSLIAALAGAEPIPYQLVTPTPHLKALLSPFASLGQQVVLVTPQGWVLASAKPKNKNTALAEDIEQHHIVVPYWQRTLLHWILSSSESLPKWSLRSGRVSAEFMQHVLQDSLASQWFQGSKQYTNKVVAGTPVVQDDQVIGAVLVANASDEIVSLTDKAWLGMIGVTFWVIILVVVVLVGYAVLLSSRIRRLSRLAEQVLTAEGQLAQVFPASKRKDEIGDLSRSFKVLHQRLWDYMHYLQSLSSKLAHELRTPLAVMRSSLENLEMENSLSNTAKDYVLRAKDGADRLRHLIDAMSEAKRVEQSLAQAEPECFPLDQVVNGMVLAYQDVYSNHCLQVDIQPGSYSLWGEADFIVQLLDKLVDNAVDFTPAQGLIRIALKHEQESYYLTVFNQGSSLPDSMRDQLFDSLVSVRKETSSKQHLGFGLHIAKLIVDWFQGRIMAENAEGEHGVIFTVVLPKINRYTPVK
ncbi:ATP-binding protein [Zooshikella ganghwensis]|uniref:histidine kinase n=1 Tax=Zooshikella ganghwensis TaxID=202772 RepID=A0A4P9VR34_9GAMM|nr:ATP-binding protein [Zooshikella ganghwensis]RDH45496.1 HAMP domain-containing protein [Zooshikella ganghwensis]